MSDEVERGDDGLPVLGVLSQVELRSVWNKEDRVFTPWLAKQENLDLLADELGLPPIEKHGMEVPVGRYAADLVCLDADGTHIKYVVWVAADFRDEHVAAIEWLNEHLAGKISVFACRVETWRIGKSQPAVKFQVVAQPSTWTAAIRGLDERLLAEGIDANRESYWAAFSEVLRSCNIPVKIREEPPRQGFYTFTLDASKGAYLYAYRVVGAKAIGAYLSLILVPGVVRVVYERLFAQKDAIEAELGEVLQWSELNADRNYRAQVEPVEGDALDEADWPRQHAWLADQVDRLYRVFKPRIDALPDANVLARDAGMAKQI